MLKVRWWFLVGELKKMILILIFIYDKYSMVYDLILDL